MSEEQVPEPSPGAGKKRPHWALIMLFVGLVAGLLAGSWLGRSTAPSFDEQVGELREKVAKVDSQLAKIPSMYRTQATAKDGAATAAKISALVAAQETALEPVMADATWLTAEQRRQVAEALDAVRDGSRRNVAVTTLNARVSETRSLLKAFFGLPATKS